MHLLIYVLICIALCVGIWIAPTLFIPHERQPYSARAGG